MEVMVESISLMVNSTITTLSVHYKQLYNYYINILLCDRNYFDEYFIRTVIIISSSQQLSVDKYQSFYVRLSMAIDTKNKK